MRYRRLLSWLVGVIVAVGQFVSMADAAMLCARKDKEGNASGAVTIRESCKKNETPVDLVGLGLAGPSIVVKDANETLIGVLLDSNAILARLENSLARLPFLSSKFQEGYVQLWYESVDCSGQALAVSSGPASMREGQIVGSIFYAEPVVFTGTTALHARGEISPNHNDPSSCQSPSFFVPPHMCCIPLQTPWVMPVGPVQLFDVSGFVPPFRVEVQP